MTVAMAICEAIVIIIIPPYQEFFLSASFFALGLDMAIALDIAVAMAITKASSLL